MENVNRGRIRVRLEGIEKQRSNARHETGTGGGLTHHHEGAQNLHSLELGLEPSKRCGGKKGGYGNRATVEVI